MPTFDTPEPISVTLELGVGDVRITASDRTDTVVEVRPSDESNESDVQAAEQTRVEYADGRLLVRAPKSWRRSTSPRGPRSVDVPIELPAGSQVHGETGVGDVPLRGPARRVPVQDRRRRHPARPDRARCELRHRRRRRHRRSGSRATPRSRTGSGDGAHRRDRRRRRGQELQRRHLDRRGHRRPAGARGQRRHRRRPGAARRSTRRPPTAASASARSPAARSTLETAIGDLEIGIRDGHRRLARRQHRLRAACATRWTPPTGPAQADETVEVRARTSFGDITIRRS